MRCRFRKNLSQRKTFDGDAPSAHRCRAFCAGWWDICSNMTDEPGLFTSRVSVNEPSVETELGSEANIPFGVGDKKRGKCR